MGERGGLAFCQNRGIKSCFEEYPYTVFNTRRHIFASSRNVTPRRMLKKCFLTAQMNTDRSIAFRICKTKNRKTPKIMDNFSDVLTLEGAGCPPCQLLGYP